MYDLDAQKMQRRVYGIATALSAVIGVGISHSFAAVDRKEVNSCLVFDNRRCHLQQPVMSDTAAILPRLDSTAMNAYYARIGSFIVLNSFRGHVFFILKSDYVSITPPNRLTWPCVFGNEANVTSHANIYIYSGAQKS